MDVDLIKETKDVVFGIILFLILSIVAVFILKWLASIFWSLDKTIQASLIGAFVAVFSILITFWNERSRALRESHREQKIKVYSVFFDFIFDTLQKARNDQLSEDLANDPDFKENWMKMSKDLLFYGSPKVLTAFNELTLKAGNSNELTIEVIKRMGKILLAMRTDIGLSNRGLNSVTIHQIYVNEDIEKALAD